MCISRRTIRPASETGLTAIASRVRWEGDDLHGEVTALVPSGDIAPAKVVFNRASGRRELRDLVDEDDWPPLLNELCARVIEAERKTGSHLIRLCDVARPSETREYRLPFLPPLPCTSMAIWFGDGGTGKSLLALKAAGELVQKGVPTLYLDWEWDEGEHRLRLERLFGAAMPRDVFYWRCDRPLPQIAEQIRSAIKQQGIRLRRG